MKKGLSFFAAIAGMITITLRYVSTNGLLKTAATNTTQEVDMTTFLSGYNNNLYNKLELKDGTDLKWYQLMANDAAQDTIMWLKAKDIYTIYTTTKPVDTSLPELGISLTGSTVPVDIVYDEKSFLISFLLEQILPIIFFLLIIMIFFKMMNKWWWWFSPFWSMKAGVLRTKTDSDTKFDDVAGMAEVKDELIELVDFLKNPKKYKDLWAKIPKWVLLYWEPGSGKTLLARAVAGEANVPFFSASWSEFMEMLVGMWAAKVRELFKKAKAASPSIIFIDEIDSIGRKRGNWQSWGHQEQEQTLNQILTEMDGFEKDTSIIVIAATNRPDTLDSALTRSGRFDRKIMVGRPTLEERKLILEYHAKDKKFVDDIDFDALVRRTSGQVWADLANILNEAALKTAKDDRKKITNEDLNYALEKIAMWPEKKIKSLKDNERKIITYHELGHAVAAYHTEHADPVEKITIVSRGRSLGATWYVPKEDSYLTSKAEFLDKLVSLLWGRAAEEIFFGKENVTTGASNDFERVTAIAQSMILKYGMDEELGTLVYLDQDNNSYKAYQPYSEETAIQIDQKIRALVRTAYDRALQILNDNRHIMDKMAELLMEKEYITRDEFVELMKDPSKIDTIVADMKQKHAEHIASKAKAEEAKKNKKKKKTTKEEVIILDEWDTRKKKSKTKKQ